MLKLMRISNMLQNMLNGDFREKKHNDIIRPACCGAQLETALVHGIRE